MQPTLICLVTVERDRVRFVQTGAEGRWELRVTQVYELVDGSWRVAHRHADPLVERHELGDILSFAYS